MHYMKSRRINMMMAGFALKFVKARPIEWSLWCRCNRHREVIGFRRSRRVVPATGGFERMIARGLFLHAT